MARTRDDSWRAWIAGLAAFASVTLILVTRRYGLSSTRRLGSTTWEEIGASWYLYAMIGAVLFALFYFFLPDEKSTQVLVCRDCGEPRAGEGHSAVCPKCKGALEPLEGFYERHPQHARDR